MSELEFDFENVIAEIDALNKLVGNFCQPRSKSVLPELISTLRSIRGNEANRSWPWGIKENNQFFTDISRGAYQPDEQGGDNVFAEITSTWEVRRIAPKKRSAQAERFKLIGNASTRVRLHREVPAGAALEELAMWRAEIGDSASPGCHFHVQVLGDKEHPPYPKSLDVPRFPGLIVTPAGVVEYVLSELFQDRWLQHLSTQRADLDRWWPIQKKYLGAVLGWQLKVVNGSSSGSPWGTLKKAKPNARLFLEEQLA